jgi:hypothetical protein
LRKEDIKIPYTSTSHVHRPQIFQQKMVLILHTSIIFSHSPTHDPSLACNFWTANKTWLIKGE